MSTTAMSVPRLLAMNVIQWNGNWTAAGIGRISLDVRNPNGFSLSMRLGVAGPGGQGPNGSGDTHVTGAATVPADNVWHALTFDVLPSDFTSINGFDSAAALTNVAQLRVIHNADVSFAGAAMQGDFYLDNIRALGSPACQATITEINWSTPLTTPCGATLKIKREPACPLTVRALAACPTASLTA